MKAFGLISVIGGALLGMVGAMTMRAGTITTAEVRIDGTPARAMSLLASTNRERYWEGDFELRIDTADLTTGPHWLDVRMQGDNGKWCAWQGQWFRIAGQPHLVAAEWYLDNDPGLGKGTPIALPADGQWDEADEELVVGTRAVDSWPVGHHTLFVRCQDSEGNWGTPNQTVFYVAESMHLVAAEWTTNLDAEAGTGHPMAPEDGVFDGAEENLIATNNTASLDESGAAQTVFVRVQDNLGRWSTRPGMVWDSTSANWQFDPLLGWKDAKVEGITVIADSDKDGIPDAWELATFGSLAVAGLGTDYDGDGLNDDAEYVAGTNPKDSLDVLRIKRLSVSGTPAALTLSFDTKPKRIYGVLRADSLSSAWQTVLELNGDGTERSYTSTTTPAGNAFFKLVVHFTP